MPVTSPRRRLVLVAALMALVFVPGSMSGVVGATAAEPLDVALGYLDKNADELGVTSADVADVAVTSQYRSSHSGVTHVNLNQRVEGLEVFGAHVTVNVAADGRVIFAGGSLVPLGAQSGGASLPADRGGQGSRGRARPRRAGESAGDQHRRRPGTGNGRVAGGDLDRADPGCVWAGSRPRTACGRPGSSSSTTPRTAHLWNATVDAETGQLLAKDDWTSHDSLGTLSTLERSGPASAQAPLAANVRLAEPGDRRLELPGVRVPAGEPERRAAQPRGEPGRLGRVAVRLARHERHPRPRVPEHAGEQRARVPRPGRRRGRRRGLRHERRARVSTSTSPPT